MRGRVLTIATGHSLSLALLDGKEVLATVDEDIGRGHDAALMPAIARLLAPFGGPASSCERIVVATGPGSFTGLRIGLAAASALALAWGVPLSGIRSTRLVAADVRARGEDAELLVMLAAPRGQIWVERFAAGRLSGLQPPAALDKQAARALAAEVPLLAGTGVGALGLSGIGGAPQARALAGLDVDALDNAELLYVRNG